MFLKGAVEKIETHILYSKIFFEILTVYKIKWKNSADRGRPHMTIRCVRISCWMSKFKNTQLQYVKLIALPLQQRLYKSASMLPYKYIACLVYDSIIKYVQIFCRKNEKILYLSTWHTLPLIGKINYKLSK
jgi:hypothetical protein